jgi:hypothetical protein
MGKLYGNPQKLIRHVDEDEFTLEPERMYIHLFWRYHPAAASRTDGDDLENDKTCPLGSRITRHKLTLTVTPETIEPQNLYMGLVKLSYHDIYATPVCGGRFVQASSLDTSTENFVDATQVSLGLWPDDYDSGATIISDGHQIEREFDGSATITDVLLQDNLKHFLNLKKVTVFDQRPLFTDRWQRIPSKVKRINEGTFYGLCLYNDSDRGATPADTQLSFNVKSYWEEKAI